MTVHAPILVFYSYAPADELLRQELEKHLSPLRQQGLISEWCDRQILAGTDWKQTLDDHINMASIILLLISPDFLASDYHYTIEMQRALERHHEENIYVIPILLRPVDLAGSPFAQLQCLPHNARPITTWSNQDEAFRDVVESIRLIIENVISETTPFSLRNAQTVDFQSPAPTPPAAHQTGPRIEVSQRVGKAEGHLIGILIRKGTIKEGKFQVKQGAIEANEVTGVQVGGAVEGGDFSIIQEVERTNGSGEIVGISVEELS